MTLKTIINSYKDLINLYVCTLTDSFNFELPAALSMKYRTVGLYNSNTFVLTCQNNCTECIINYYIRMVLRVKSLDCIIKYIPSIIVNYFRQWSPETCESVVVQSCVGLAYSYIVLVYIEYTIFMM